jgi:hypothetical protein
MGVRGELFSTRMACDGRTYFFNVKENRMGDLFLSIVESKPTETDEFDRRSIVVFQDNVEEFIKALRKSVDAMGEADPSVRSAKPPRVRRDAKLPRDDGRDAESRLSDDERPRHYIDTGKPRGAGPRGAGPRGPETRGPETRGDGARRAETRRAETRSRAPSLRTSASRDSGHHAGEHRAGEHRAGEHRAGEHRAGPAAERGPRRDDDRQSSVRRDIERSPAPTGRVLRVKPKASPATGDTKPVAKAKTPARRMTVRSAKPKDEE